MTADSPQVVAAAGQADAQEKLAAGMSSLEIAQGEQQPDLAPHRSHDPDYNQKRSDPFQFGSRYLGQQDNVFEFNAWDHVETDDTYKEYAEQQYAMQRDAPVSDFDKSKWTFFLFIEILLSRAEMPGACDDLQIISIVHLIPMKTIMYFIVFRSHLMRTKQILSMFAY